MYVKRHALSEIQVFITKCEETTEKQLLKNTYCLILLVIDYSCNNDNNIKS